ncbi:MAG: hypothetical protein GY842_09845 [bacterium]|nr:hypothetical protein [bacterium]
MDTDHDLRYPFEPIVFEPARGRLPERFEYVPVVVYFVGFFVVRWLDLGLLYAMLGFAVAFWGTWAIALGLAHYYRVAPGRLDVIKRRFMRTHVVCVRSIPLSEARIVCHYGRRTLTISEGPDEVAESCTIHLARVSAPHAFVQAVFRAARCPECATPLPDDAFLG